MFKHFILVAILLVLSNISMGSLPIKYYELFPYHFKYCVETQYHMRGPKNDRTDDITGIKTGHTVFYLNGVKKANDLSPKGKRYLELVTDDSLKENPKQGIGFSVNAIFKSSPFMMVDNVEDLLTSPLGEAPITLENLEFLAEIAVNKGYFDHMKFQLKNSSTLWGQLFSKSKNPSDDLVCIKDPSQYNRAEKLKMAGYTIGTDLFVNTARAKTYCMNIPLTKEMATKVMNFINEAGENPQGGIGAAYPGYISNTKKETDYYEYHFLDHCGVLPRNALGEVNIISKSKTNVPVIMWPIFEQFPLDTLLSLLSKATHPSKVSYLKEYDHLYLNPGTLLEVIGIHEDNNVFIQNFTIKGYGINYIWGKSYIESYAKNPEITYTEGEDKGLKLRFSAAIRDAKKYLSKLESQSEQDSPMAEKLRSEIENWEEILVNL